MSECKKSGERSRKKLCDCTLYKEGYRNTEKRCVIEIEGYSSKFYKGQEHEKIKDGKIIIHGKLCFTDSEK